MRTVLLGGGGERQLPADLQVLALTFLSLEELVQLRNVSRDLTRKANLALFRIPSVALTRKSDRRRSSAAAIAAKAECIAQYCRRLRDVDILAARGGATLDSRRRILERNAGTLTALELGGHDAGSESLLPLVAACGPTLRRLTWRDFDAPGGPLRMAELVARLPHLTALLVPHLHPSGLSEHQLQQLRSLWVRNAPCPIRTCQLPHLRHLRSLGLTLDLSLGVDERLQFLRGLAAGAPSLHSLSLTVECSLDTLLSPSHRAAITFPQLQRLSVRVDAWATYNERLHLPAIVAPALRTLCLESYSPPLTELVRCFPALERLRCWCLDGVAGLIGAGDADLRDAAALLDRPNPAHWKTLHTLYLVETTLPLAMLTAERLPALTALSVDPPSGERCHAYLRDLLSALPQLESLGLPTHNQLPPAPPLSTRTLSPPITHSRLRALYGAEGALTSAIDGVLLPNLDPTSPGQSFSW